MLGTIRVSVGDEAVGVGGAKPRTILARLAMSAPETVPADGIIDAVWGEAVPAKAINTFHVHLSNLRRALKAAAGDDGEIIATRPGGYGLDVDETRLDLLRFRSIMTTADDHAAADRPLEAAALYREALALWRGDPLADLAASAWAENEAVALARQRSIAHTRWIDAELASGNHLSILADLERAAGENPLDERIAGQLMLGLYRAGRQTDALRQFEETRRRLAEEIGVEPGPELRELESRILRQDVVLPKRPAILAGEGDRTRVRDAPLESAALDIEGRRHRLGSPITTIGRRGDQDIVVDDEDVSRQHAHIESDAEGHRIVDLDSTNGTWVAGQRVRRELLTDGVEITLGRTVMVFREAVGTEGSRL